MTQEEKAKAYDEAVDYAKRSLSRLSEDYRCEILTKDGIRYNYSKLFPGEEEFRTDSNEWLKMKLIVGLESLLKQGKETFAGADIEAMIEYLKKPNTPKLFNDEKYQTVPVETLDRLYASEKELSELKQKINERFDDKQLREAVVDEIGKYTNFYDTPWALDSTGVGYPFHFAELGAKWQKEQMMNKAVETVVSLEAGGFPVIEFGVKRFGLKVGDKVRVIISPKED